MPRLSRRHLLQLGASTAMAAYWGAGCSPAAQPPPQEPSLPSSVDPTFEHELASNEVTSAATVDSAEVGGRLRIALSALPNSLDPASFAIVEAYPFGAAVFDALVWVDATLTPQPMLAESWEPSTDRLSWLFKLRRNVTFHHGTPLTAADVEYTFRRLLDPETDSVLRPLLRFIDGVEAVDDGSSQGAVRFRLNTPNADLPLLLASPQARILAHDYPLEQLLTHPSGTGPFLFVELLAGDRINYVRNPVYWAAEQIHVAELHHLLIPSFDAQVAALLQGEVDLLLDVAGDALAALIENPETTVVEAASGRYQNLALRVADPPFDDLRVRQALKACTDRTMLQQRILQGRGEIGHDHPLASISPFFTDLPLHPYNPAAAHQLLMEAGYPEGLQLQLITADAAPGMVALAYAFQEMARPAGIDIEVVEVKVPADIYFNEYWGRVPFYVSAWEFRPSVYETFALAYHSWSPWNETGWFSETLDQLLDEAYSAADSDRREELYQQAQQLLLEEGAVIIPYFLPVFSAMRKNVKGFQPHPAGWVDLRNIQVVDQAD